MLRLSNSQHLTRKHCDNPNQCLTCGKCFLNKLGDYKAHVIARGCEPKPYEDIEFTNKEAVDIIRASMERSEYGKSNNEEGKWTYVFKRLFKDHQGNVEPCKFQCYS